MAQTAVMADAIARICKEVRAVEPVEGCEAVTGSEVFSEVSQAAPTRPRLIQGLHQAVLRTSALAEQFQILFVTEGSIQALAFPNHLPQTFHDFMRCLVRVPCTRQ